MDGRKEGERSTDDTRRRSGGVQKTSQTNNAFSRQQPAAGAVQLVAAGLAAGKALKGCGWVGGGVNVWRAGEDGRGGGREGEEWLAVAAALCRSSTHTAPRLSSSATAADPPPSLILLIAVWRCVCCCCRRCLTPAAGEREGREDDGWAAAAAAICAFLSSSAAIPCQSAVSHPQQQRVRPSLPGQHSTAKGKKREGGRGGEVLAALEGLSLGRRHRRQSCAVVVVPISGRGPASAFCAGSLVPPEAYAIDCDGRVRKRWNAKRTRQPN
ncbi:hypothetical protein niasHS_001046 [Heterodera schachtii]|uniref:Uncharacterized protein n=1 Tax=Heterodera schachtii TaxID=97005 RepID=A0ABD2K877_HETSC